MPPVHIIDEDQRRRSRRNVVVLGDAARVRVLASLDDLLQGPPRPMVMARNPPPPWSTPLAPVVEERCVVVSGSWRSSPGSRIEVSLIDGLRSDGRSLHERMSASDGAIVATDVASAPSAHALAERVQTLGLPAVVFVEGGALDHLLDDIADRVPPPAETVGTPLRFDVFAIEDCRWGKLAWIRVRGNTLSAGTVVVNARTGAKVDVRRLVRMRYDEKEELPSASAGDICALFRGFACEVGDVFSAPTIA